MEDNRNRTMAREGKRYILANSDFLVLDALKLSGKLGLLSHKLFVLLVSFCELDELRSLTKGNLHYGYRVLHLRNGLVQIQEACFSCFAAPRQAVYLLLIVL